MEIEDRLRELEERIQRIEDVNDLVVGDVGQPLGFRKKIRGKVVKLTGTTTRINFADAGIFENAEDFTASVEQHTTTNVAYQIKNINGAEIEITSSSAGDDGEVTLNITELAKGV